MTDPTPAPALVELVARTLCNLAYGAEDDHAPWNYTQFGAECSCGAAIVADDWCTAHWDHMPVEGRDYYRTDARAVLSALATEGRLPTEWEYGVLLGDRAPLVRACAPFADRDDAERMAAMLNRPDRPAHVYRRAVGPWQPAPDTEERP